MPIFSGKDEGDQLKKGFWEFAGNLLGEAERRKNPLIFHSQPNLTDPLPVVFRPDVPVRDHADRLVDQFVPPLGFAHRFHRKGPEIRDPRNLQLHAEFLPLVHKPQKSRGFRGQAGAQIPQLSAAVVEVPVLAVPRKPRKIELRAEEDGLPAWKVRKPPRDLQLVPDEFDRFADRDRVRVPLKRSGRPGRGKRQFPVPKAGRVRDLREGPRRTGAAFRDPPA